MPAQDASRQVGLPDANAAPAALPKAIIGGIVAGFVLSWLYGPAGYYCPIIYLNLALTYAMGWMVGRAAQAMVMKWRIDGAAGALLVGAVSGVFAAWFSWLTYVWTISGFNFMAYVYSLNPLTLFEYMRYLAHVPRWSLGGRMAPSFYYGLWALEFLAITGLSAHRCLMFVKDNLLCGKCGEWAKPTGDIAAFTLPADATMPLRDIANGDMVALARLERRPPAGDGSASWLMARGYACPNCLDLDSMVSVSLVRLQLNKKTKEYEAVERPLVKFAPVDVELERRIFEMPAVVLDADPEEAGERQASRGRAKHS